MIAASLTKEEALHPDLEDYLSHDEGFDSLRHPLAYSVPHGASLNGYANQLYVQKLRGIEEARSEGDWTRYILLHERPWRPDALLEIAGEMGDREYWETLGWIWADTENLWQWGWRLKALLERPGREWMMRPGDREALAGLPDPVTVYRGYCRHGGRKGWSWTTRRETAVWFASRFASAIDSPKVIRGTIPKDQVIAYLLGRGEFEVIADPEMVRTARTVRALKHVRYLASLGTPV